MATTIDLSSSFTPALRRMADQLVADYKACGAERGRLHALSYDLDDPNAELALDLLTLPSDDVINIARMIDGGVPTSDHKRFAELLTARPTWSRVLSLVEWLRADVNCPKVASLIERSDYLRLVLLSILVPVSKQSA